MIHQQIDHIGLNVADLEQSIVFYRDMLGFELIEKWDDTKQAFMGTGGTRVVLGLMEMPSYDFFAHTMSHIAFACDEEDFPRVVDKVHEWGLQIVAGPKTQRGGQTLLFRDPSGNILEICYPSIESWQLRQKAPE